MCVDAMTLIRQQILACKTSDEVVKVIDDIDERWLAGSLLLHDDDWPEISRLVAVWKENHIRT